MDYRIEKVKNGYVISAAYSDTQWVFVGLDSAYEFLTEQFESKADKDAE